MPSLNIPGTPSAGDVGPLGGQAALVGMGVDQGVRDGTDVEVIRVGDRDTARARARARDDLATEVVVGVVVAMEVEGIVEGGGEIRVRVGDRTGGLVEMLRRICRRAFRST